MAQIIDGKKIAKDLRTKIKVKVDQLIADGKRRPGLDVILVGENPASQIYVRNKHRACAEVGFDSHIHRLPENTGETELLELIQRLNEDPAVDGILCQLPLPEHLSEELVIETIAPEKDVDGFHPINSGHLFSGGKSLLPCTAAGIIYMLKAIDFEFEGKDALVIGRSNIVGKPTAILLLNENCTVTIAHSKTKNLQQKAAQADLLVTSVGVTNFINKEFTNPEQVIIDVSINRNTQNKVVGDVVFDEVEPLVKAITPVPGGVGPMTIAMLLKNTLLSYQQRTKG